MRGLNSGRLHQFENAAGAMAGTSRMVIGRNNEARSSAGSNAAARAVSAVADIMVAEAEAAKDEATLQLSGNRDRGRSADALHRKRARQRARRDANKNGEELNRPDA